MLVYVSYVSLMSSLSTLTSFWQKMVRKSPSLTHHHIGGWTDPNTSTNYLYTRYHTIDDNNTHLLPYLGYCAWKMAEIVANVTKKG